MEKRAFEQTGLVPRSIIRTFDRFRRQLLKGAETSVIQEFRVSRYQVLVSVKCLASLLVIPLVVNFLAKTFFLMPLTEYLWNTQQNEIFLNLYQENRAFSELHDFEEKLFFESLIETQSAPALTFTPSEIASNTKNLLQPSKPLYNNKTNEIMDGITKDTKKISKENDLQVDLLFQPHVDQEKNLLTPFRVLDKADRKDILWDKEKQNELVRSESVLKDFEIKNQTFDILTSDISALTSPVVMLEGGKGDVKKVVLKSDISTPSFRNTNLTPLLVPTPDNQPSLSSQKDVWDVKGLLFSTNTDTSLTSLTSLRDVWDVRGVRSGDPSDDTSLTDISKRDVKKGIDTSSCAKQKSVNKKRCWQTVLTDVKLKEGQAMSTFYLENSLPQKFQQKTIELAIYYNQQSIEAITNLFGDFITFITISFLFIWMEPQIIILKSFLTESLYSLSDTTKSFLLILLTDLLVGFHSPRGWEIFIELILRHFGLPENQDFIFLFVATFPVLLDTVFKYWIFRYLNQISPSTVATYHSMIE